MANNVKLIYDLILKDLKAKGWDEVAIAEAIAECERERQKIRADDNTICVKELSYLSQESQRRIATQMNDNKNKTNILVRLKDWIVNLAKDYWQLNWEAKIGILFLIPPIFIAIIFILFLLFMGFDSTYIFFKIVPKGLFKWTIGSNHIARPLYVGMMAIAGAYFIKGNLKRRG